MSEIKDVSIWVLLGLTAIVICLFYPAHHVSYDAYNAASLVARLHDSGIPVKKVISVYDNYEDGMKAIRENWLPIINALKEDLK